MYWVESGTGCRNNKTFCIVRKMCFRKFIAETIPPERYSPGGLRVTCKKGAYTQPPRIGRVGSHSSLSERIPAGMRENDLLQKLCGTAAGLTSKPAATAGSAAWSFQGLHWRFRCCQPFSFAKIFEYYAPKLMFPTTNGHVLIKNVAKRMRKGRNERILGKNASKQVPEDENRRIFEGSVSN